MQEICRQRARQDRQVGLDVAGRQVRGGAGQLAAARIQPRLPGQLHAAARPRIGNHDYPF
ncbi:hypothetical protein D9M69_716200 [compost metagenome]